MMEAIPDQGPRAEGHGSRTITVTSTPDREAGPSTASPTESSREGTPSAVGVLRLRGGPARRQRVVWSAETIDNEGMGKKKSKICCIYHKPRRFDESSSESDSCSDDDDHSCSGEGSHSHGGSAQRARPSGGGAEIEEESSESDGGAGDGRARPARRPRKKHHSHQPKANKYDSKGKGKESPSHDSPENARS